jgi:NAD(P)-dependent dehydrogenase (short-subunit alcohol dehydrogenase family)
MPRLADKVAIVTGAAHGIGRAIAERFADEGAWVLVADLDREAGEAVVSEILERGGQSQFACVDVASREQISAAVEVAASRAGRIDILVNNAALLGEEQDIQDSSSRQWDDGYAVTFMSAVHFTSAVLPWMIPHGRGSIINMASIQGLRGARCSPIYTSMKHALVGLTRSTACDFGPQGIRVNAICPGPIRTRISPPPGSELHQRQIGKTMLGRTGEPNEVAWAVVFLASDESSYITGITLPVDGGWTAF